MTKFWKQPLRSLLLVFIFHKINNSFSEFVTHIRPILPDV